jgi:thiol-disulfide isomerase/thioredoxin
MLAAGCADGESQPSTASAPAAPASTSVRPAAPEEAVKPDAVAKADGPAAETVPAAKIVPAEPPTVAAPDSAAIAELEEPAVPVGELMIGDAAPAINIATWVKGEPVTAFSSEKVHVVEFWATWCGPCLASMPHIAGLQVEYGDKVTFIGVSDEDEATVSGFMKETARGSDKTWADTLTYTIALDDNRKTNAAYMQAAGQNGIPCAFIVGRNGKVEWIGHPMEIDEPLKQIVDGNWDSEKARVDFLTAREMEKAMEEAGPQIMAAIQSGDFKAAVGHVDELIAKYPNEERLTMTKLSLLLRGGLNEEASQAAAPILQANNDNAMQLNQLVWMLVTSNDKPGIDLELAHKYATRAVELTQEKDGSILDTLGRVTFKKGLIDEAIAIQQKAIAVTPDPQMQEQLQGALKEYEAAKGASSAPATDSAAPAGEQPAADAAAGEAPPTDN